MNRTELFERFDKITIGITEQAYYDIKHLFSIFLDQNVCIPKGENRHPYADVLH